MTYTSAYIGPRWGEETAGLVLSAVGFAGMIVSPFAGLLVDRLGPIRVASLGITGMFIAFLSMTRAGTVAGFFLAFAVLGLASSTTWASLNTLSVKILPAARGSVASIYNTFRFSGYAIAPAALAIVFTGYGVDAVYTVSALAAIAALGLVRIVCPLLVIVG